MPIWQYLLCCIVALELSTAFAWAMVFRSLDDQFQIIALWLVASAAWEVLKANTALHGRNDLGLSLAYTVASTALLLPILRRWGAGRWAVVSWTVVAVALASTLAGWIPSTVAVAAINACIFLCAQSILSRRNSKQISGVALAIGVFAFSSAVFNATLLHFWRMAPCLAWTFWFVRCGFVVQGYVLLFWVAASFYGVHRDQS